MQFSDYLSLIASVNCRDMQNVDSIRGYFKASENRVVNLIGYLFLKSSVSSDVLFQSRFLSPTILPSENKVENRIRNTIFLHIKHII